MNDLFPSDNFFGLQGYDDDSEFIPIMTVGDEGEDDKGDNFPEELPILPLRNTVLFPGVVIPITVGRDKSIKLIRDANAANKTIGVVSQKDVSVEDPGFGDLHQLGAVARILKMLRMPDGNTTVIIQGRQRFRLEQLTATEPYLKARVTHSKDIKPRKNDKEFDALIGSMKDMAQQIIQMSPNIPSEAAIALKNIDSPAFLVNFIASNLNTEVAEKQRLLEIENLKDRATEVLTLMSKEFQMLELKNQIQSKVKVDLDKQQREYFLHQQLKTIQEELGGATPDLEVQNLRERGKSKKWSKQVQEHFNKELDKLQRMNPAAADYSVVLNYVELMLDLPWDKFSKDRFDLKRAKKILDADHYGLEKVKDRILEYLAVLKLKANMKAPILLLVGPPGVGKTSLGKSIARAVGREYVRMSLGGVHDEATIRGHRKTYIGAMPGRIIQSIKKAGSSNPVMVLDEIDKVGSDYRGDVSSALLEVLDPEQNSSFFDHYLELDYDLSKVLFIATANNLQPIQPALLDRMEVIEINGYTIEEKIEIAKKYLIPKQLEEHGLEKADFKLSSSMIRNVIECYTRESGVRTLDKRIASLVRGYAKLKALEEAYHVEVDAAAVRKILGPRIFEQDQHEGNETAGVVTGLAWTAVGGDILFIETSISRGKGRLTITGNLGDVMKESASLAMSYVRTHAEDLGIDYRLFDYTDVYIHVPEGATPKDGPSAGITMLSSIISAFTQRKLRNKLAMTGEITLRGKVLPVGGIKEKILAAKRAGITDIIMSEQNRKDVEDIKPEYINDLSFHYVKRMEEVVDIALLKSKIKGAKDFSAYIEDGKKQAALKS
ncbi:MAG: endopeptidase La [Bacteroidia bacterium]